MIIKQVKAHSPAPVLREKNCDAAFFSQLLVRKWGYYVCVCMITRRRKRVKRTFLSHSHSPPPHPHCYSLPPHPQFPSCAFFRVYWMFFPHPATKPAFSCHNLTAWCSVVLLHAGMVKCDKLIEAHSLLASQPPSFHLTDCLGSLVGDLVFLKSRKYFLSCTEEHFLCPVTMKGTC